MHVHTLGPVGTFSYEAALKLFPAENILLHPNFDQLFVALSSSPKDIGVVPIENSLFGSVDEVLDLLIEGPAKLWKTQDIEIHHAFGAKKPDEVLKVASHPQALRQCRKWLKAHYPQAEYFPVSSTAFAAELAAHDPRIGAIASREQLTLRSLSITANDIEGQGNTTRFGIISVSDPFPENKRNQLTLVLRPTIGDRPGLLHDILTPFKNLKINMSRIENRPTGTKLGDYLFVVECTGRIGDMVTEELLAHLREICDVQVIGEW